PRRRRLAHGDRDDSLGALLLSKATAAAATAFATLRGDNPVANPAPAWEASMVTRRRRDGNAARLATARLSSDQACKNSRLRIRPSDRGGGRSSGRRGAGGCPRAWPLPRTPSVR